jgi:hypothetical protein
MTISARVDGCVSRIVVDFYLCFWDADLGLKLSVHRGLKNCPFVLFGLFSDVTLRVP